MESWNFQREHLKCRCLFFAEKAKEIHRYTSFLRTGLFTEELFQLVHKGFGFGFKAH